jgi:hypothetical protein
MIILRSLLITSVVGAGVALVLWLVSQISGSNEAWFTGVLALVFAMCWFWVYLGMKDPELQSDRQ